MLGAQKTRCRLKIEYPGEPELLTDEVTEFAYNYDVMGVGETCEFSVVSLPDGSRLRRLREGATVTAEMRTPSVNGGKWTVKHRGLIVTRELDCAAGTIKITSADKGWHLLHCSAPIWRRLRGLRLRDLLDPQAPAKTRFIDATFGFRGLRTGMDANALNRFIKLGKAGLIPPGQSPTEPVPVLQIEPGESYFDTLSRFAQRFNLLIGVSVDDYLQAWVPDYEREPAYSFRLLSGRDAIRSNVKNIKRHDDITTRYTAVTVVGEIVVPPVDLRGQSQDAFAPNANKRRGFYEAAPGLLPFNHRKTSSNGEMFTGDLARRQAEWEWKRGMFDSHYLEVEVADHFQAGDWLEADQMADVLCPEADARGRYYVAQVRCRSTMTEGDETTLILRWPHLMSASFGEWKNPPRYSGKQKTELTPGKGGGQ